MKFQRLLSIVLCTMLMCSLCSGFASAAEKYAYAPLTVTFEDANCEIELTFSQASVGHSLLVAKSYAYEMDEMGKMFMAEYDINENGEMVYMTTQEDMIVVKDGSDVKVNIIRAEPKAAGSGGIGTSWDVRGTVSWFGSGENGVAMMYCDTPSDPANAAKFMKSGKVEQLLGAVAEATKGYSTDCVCLLTSQGHVLTESYYKSVLGSIEPEREATRYQSTAKLTGAYISEMDFASFDITVTNPTDARDSGTVCAVLTNKGGNIGEIGSAYGAAVKFIDYDLNPGESKTYTVQSSGIIGITDIGGNNLALVGTALSQIMSCDIITFEDDADRDAYRATVPYEHQWANESEMDCDRLCYGSYGDQWLKNYTGIRDYGIIIDTSGDHSLCKVK